MKGWQLLLVLALLAAAGWAVVSYPPGSRIVVQEKAVGVIPSSPPTPTSVPVHLLFAGDIMLSRSVGDVTAARNDWSWPFARIASVTREADIAYANLETTISTRGAVSGCVYCFRADPRVVEGLTFAGFDVLSVANNHIWDYGRPALEDTLSYLAANDISAVGAGRTLEEARGPVVRTVNGTRFAFLAYTDLLPAGARATESRAGVNTFDEQSMIEDIVRARGQTDIVIVSFHTGTEYEPRHNPTQERIYRTAVDAGADLVVGHHPHVVQDTERYKGKWIFYSLGNFVFDQQWSAATKQGALLDVTVTDGSIVSVATRSVDISPQYQASLSK